VLCSDDVFNGVTRTKFQNLWEMFRNRILSFLTCCTDIIKEEEEELRV
jgi:hypothetical protein